MWDLVWCDWLVLWAGFIDDSNEYEVTEGTEVVARAVENNDLFLVPVHNKTAVLRMQDSNKSPVIQIFY